MTATSSITSRAAVLRSYQIQCGIPALTYAVEQTLRQFGWEVSAHAQVGLLIDGPWGFALKTLGQENASELVIVTDNPCPEYAEDLWMHRPRALLAGGHSVPDLSEALRRAAAGEFFRHTPQHESLLTCMERRLLRYSALGWENRRIALELNLNEGTVRNGLSRVFQKLGFENRTEIALYYWGLWHLLDNNLYVAKP